MPTKPTPAPLLIETCLEGGALTEAEITAALRGRAKDDQVKAIISLVECHIGVQHSAAEKNREGRDEACGAARALKELRREINELVSLPPE